MKMALALLCRGNIEEKYRCERAREDRRAVRTDDALFVLDIFSLTAYRASSDQDQREVVDRSRLSLLFQQAIVVS